MKFEDLNLIIEGITKEQQEAGQRAMVEQNARLKNQLIKWFNDRWGAKNAYKEGLNLRRKKVEKERFDRIIKKLEMFEKEKIKSNDDYVKELIKVATGNPPQWYVHSFKDEDYGDGKAYGYLRGTTSKREGEVYYLDDDTGEEIDPEDKLNIGINTSQHDSLAQNLSHSILHEYGHLLDMFKKIIITGKADYNLNYYDEGKNKIKKLQRSEGHAEANAIDNTYRKDRIKYLMGVEGGGLKNKKPEKVPNKIKDVYDDVYVQGTVKYSKTLKSSQKNTDLVLKNIFRKLVNVFDKSQIQQDLDKYNLSFQELYNSVELTASKLKNGYFYFSPEKGIFYFNKDYIDKLVDINKVGHNFKYDNPEFLKGFGAQLGKCIKYYGSKNESIS